MWGFEQPGGIDRTMAVRREEDLRAMAVVGATPRWLPLCRNSHVERADPIPAPPGAVDAIVDAVTAVEPTCVVAPLGLHEAGFTATSMCPSVSHDFGAKWRAFGEYAAQVAVLERLWRLRDRLERSGESYWTPDSSD